MQDEKRHNGRISGNRGVRFLKRSYKYNELYKKHICLPLKMNENHNIYEK